MNDKTMFNLTYGLFVLTAREGSTDSGCITNTASQVTAVPNRISLAINKTNFTHDMIMDTKEFNISILNQSADFELFKRFGFQSGRDVDKFKGFTGMKRAANGIYYITEGTNGYISGKVEKAVDLGTHTLFICPITDMDVLCTTPSVTYCYYQANIKPKPAARPAAGKTIWRCSVCGYEYEGEELPPDFTCPLCKHPASDFVKVTA